MNVKLLCGILALLGFGQSATYATSLGSISFFGSIVTVQPSVETDLSALLSIGTASSDCFVVGNCPAIALFQGIGPSSIGTNITIDSSNANFAAIVGRLVMGGQSIWAGVVPGSTYGTSSGGAIGIGVPDFSGETISLLQLNIDNIVIRPQLSGTQFALYYTLDVSGTAPEPSTWSGVLVGLVVLFALRRRKGNSSSL